MEASAEGLEAFEQFFSHLPADTGMAFVSVQHLEPTHKGMMPELLGRHTKKENQTNFLTDPYPMQSGRPRDAETLLRAYGRSFGEFYFHACGFAVRSQFFGFWNYLCHQSGGSQLTYGSGV